MIKKTYYNKLFLTGMEALETAIGLWEDALAAYTSGNGSGNTALTSQEEAEFTQCLQRVIDDAYTLQDQCEHLFLHQHSVLFRSTSVTPTPVPSECTGAEASFDRRTLTSLSSVDSFVSCQGDIADLADLEEFEEGLSYPLYTAALKYHEENNILYRDVRTEWVKCNSDVEYVCKVHCIRYACQNIFSQEIHKNWFIEAGREVIGNLLACSHKDPKDAVIAYDELISFLNECDWEEIEAELSLRGVKSLTFYDVVLDFILMDAFEDLENPPSSVIAVVQNRWLSNGFKESALCTAVWSVLKAKRRLLKYQDGFLAHFYNISEHLSPMLAWGFLGPNQALNDLCTFFKVSLYYIFLLNFILQSFLQSMTTVRYPNFV